MSRGDWIRCPHTGLALTAITYFSPHYDGRPLRWGLLGEDSKGDPVQNDDGTLRPEAFPDCDVFNWRTAARLAAGLPEGKALNVSRIKKRMLEDWPRCHFHPLSEDYAGDALLDGEESCNPLAMAGHTNSFQAWGEWDRAERAENSRKNLNRGTTDVSGGAIVKSADKAVVEKA